MSDPAYTYADFLQIALDCKDSMGWRVFPLGAKNKPHSKWKWVAARKTDTDNAFGRRFKWARDNRTVNGIGVITGPVSGGLAVRDFDTLAAYKAWAAAYPDLAATVPTAVTRRGRHVYFRLPPSHPGIWVKGSGGVGELFGDSKHYVALPPSLHTLGKSFRYRWDRNEPRRPSDLPVLDPVKAGLVPLTTPAGRNSESRYTREAVASPAVRVNATEDVASSSPASGSVWDAVPLEVREREAVLRCIPDGPGQRNESTWMLARQLKALPHLADRDVADLVSYVEMWHALALPHIRTKPLADSLDDFVRQWGLVRTPAGHGFRRAVAEALASEYPPEASRRQEPEVRRLMAVSAALQRSAGPGGCFYLSCRTAADVCGWDDHKTAWRWQRWLVGQGLLEVVQTGTLTGRKATRWRWTGS